MRLLGCPRGPAAEAEAEAAAEAEAEAEVRRPDLVGH